MKKSLWITVFISINIYPSIQSVGRFDRGKLLSASKLNNSGDGFVKILRQRNRSYGNDRLIKLIEHLGQINKDFFPTGERIQIGDISKLDGGKLIGHKSHQNGNDVDIVYLRNNKLEQRPTGAHHWVESFVKARKLSNNFDIQRNWKLIKKATEFSEVEAIFVDKVIFWEFCKLYAQVDPHVFKKLKISAHHKTHFHLRISCSKQNPQCVNYHYRSRPTCQKN